MIQVRVYELVAGRERSEDDPLKYRVDIFDGQGGDYHAVGTTPQEALLEATIYWCHLARPRTPQGGITTARALEVVLSRVKMDRETERILKGQLAHERQRAALETKP